MNNNILINETFIYIEAAKFEKANALLADNFRTTVLGKEVNKLVYISAFRSLLKGFPDLKLNFMSMQSEGAEATAKLKMSGTNSYAIPALVNAWHEIPATHRKIDGLIMDLEITVKDDKIEQIRDANNSKGLFASLLEHLGMDYKKLRSEAFTI